MAARWPMVALAMPRLPSLFSKSMGFTCGPGRGRGRGRGREGEVGEMLGGVGSCRTRPCPIDGRRRLVHVLPAATLAGAGLNARLAPILPLLPTLWGMVEEPTSPAMVRCLK